MDKSKILPTIHTTIRLRRIEGLKLRRGLWTNFLTTYPQITERKTINNCQNSNHFFLLHQKIWVLQNMGNSPNLSFLCKLVLNLIGDGNPVEILVLTKVGKGLWIPNSRHIGRNDTRMLFCRTHINKKLERRQHEKKAKLVFTHTIANALNK